MGSGAVGASVYAVGASVYGKKLLVEPVSSLSPNPSSFVFRDFVGLGFSGTEGLGLDN